MDASILEKPGKTLYLLKAKSKPIQSGRKRKKIELLGTFAQYKESKKKQSIEIPIQSASSLAETESNKAQRTDTNNLATYFAGNNGN